MNDDFVSDVRDPYHSHVRLTEDVGGFTAGLVIPVVDIIAHPKHQHRVLYVVTRSGKQLPRDAVEWV